MTFTPDQISELIRIVQFQHILFGAEVVGSDVLSKEDRLLLSEFGIDPHNMHVEGLPPAEEAFHFGRLSKALGNYQAKKINYNDFRKFIQAGGYKALTDYDKRVLKAIKMNTFSNIKNLGGKISSDVSREINNVVAKRRGKYERVLHDELKKTVEIRQSIQETISNIGKRTGDWERDLSRVVNTELHNAFDEGRAMEIEERDGEDALAYKDVYIGACRHCIRLYLTDGLGSEPEIFKLSVLRDNGTNIGLKPNEWKPVIGSTHPNCRCTLNDVPTGYEWNEKMRSFSKIKADYKPKHEFSIKIKIGNQEYTV